MLFRRSPLFLFAPIVALFLAFFNSSHTAHAARSVTLGWGASGGSDVAGYVVYYGTASGDYTQAIDIGASTTATLNGLDSDTTYYITVTAYDPLGRQSTPSNEIAFTTPSGPLPAVSLAGGATSTSAPAAIAVTASTSESGGVISHVDFYNGNTYLGTSTGSPYTLTLNNAGAGNYNITAQAYDTSGGYTGSNAVAIHIDAAGPCINGVKLMPNGTCSFNVAGGAYGVNKTYNIWVSSDMRNWRLLRSVQSLTGSFTLTDPTAAGAKSRFYKMTVQ